MWVCADMSVCVNVDMNVYNVQCQQLIWVHVTYHKHAYTAKHVRTCEAVSTDSRHFPDETFHILMQRSLEPPPVASKFDRHGHHDTACTMFQVREMIQTLIRTTQWD